jgi:hypothetical protein
VGWQRIGLTQQQLASCLQDLSKLQRTLLEAGRSWLPCRVLALHVDAASRPVTMHVC